MCVGMINDLDSSLILGIQIQGKEDPIKDIFPEVSQWMSGASGLPFADSALCFTGDIFSSLVLFYF